MASAQKFAFVVGLVVITILLSDLASGIIARWNPAPALTWGLVSRGFGVVYVIVFGSFHGQVVPLCGGKGVTPVAQFLAQVKEDYPGFKKVIYFPTWLWLNDSDTALRLTTTSGILGGLLAVYGGFVGWLGLLISRLALQSLAVTGEFWFVWDYMVFEAGALVLLLPETVPISMGLDVTHLPVPCVALAWQILAIRLMLGFAKTKFGEADVSKDNLFLQGFFIWQLLPNHLSWHLHHAPLWLLRAAYGFMLYAEVILPFCAFFTGSPRFVGAWGLIILMIGIYLTGNWGQFNLGYIVVCLGLLDLQVSFGSFFSQSWLLPPLMMVYLFISLICCIFDTWTNTAWPWYTWETIPVFQLHGLLGLVRFLAPFRLINAYGVFPPEALPQVRSTVVFQGSDDGGKTWKTYPYKYQVHTATSPPVWLAPHHPRLDHRVFYPFEMTSKSDMSSAYCITDHNPYCYSVEGFMHRMVQRLLEGEATVLQLFAANPFPEPPGQVRVVMSAATPTSMADHRATGHWWYVQELCEVITPRKSDPGVWSRWVPKPECFHPEHDVWRNRSRLSEALSGADIDMSNVDMIPCGDGISATEVASFWDEFIVAAQTSRGDWPTLWKRSQAIAERFGRAKVALYERILGRYVLLLRQKVTLDLLSKMGLANLMGNWRLHLLFHDVIAEGKRAYVETLKKPESLVARAGQVGEARLLDLVGLLRPDDLLFEDLKYRYICELKQRPDRRGFITRVVETDKVGFYSMLNFLLAQQPMAQLWLPKARLLDSGAWLVEGYKDQTAATGNPLAEPMLR